MSRLFRLTVQLRQVRRLFDERRLYAAALSGLVLSATLALAAVYYPDRFVTLVLDGLISGLVALVALFLSYDLLLRYGHRKERERIADLETVVDRYAGRVDLMERISAPGWHERFGGEQSPLLPFTVEHVPSRPRAMDSYEVSVEDEAYSLPDRLRLVLDPVVDDQRERFQAEGHFNGLKAGLLHIDDERVAFRPESYFQSFRTIHSPDYEIYRNRSLRELTDFTLMDDSGLVSLDETPYPNAFGAGGLVVTGDGRTVVPVRSGEVAYSAGRAEVSYGGSFDLGRIERDRTMLTQCQAELESELSITPSEVRSLVCLGVVRRLELLGSPDMLTLTVVDADATFENRTPENARLIEVDALPEGAVRTVDDLLEPERIEQLSSNVLEALRDRGYRPGPALVATLGLLAQHAERSE